MVVSAPRCTPPMPPVTKTRMPAIAATIMVPATVVAPVWRRATTMGRSRREHFTTPWAWASAVISAWLRPTRSSPPTIAMVAGTAQPSRMTASTASAVSTLAG
ncbi:hypothetical protein D3C72_1094990 [compost metagenome]